jgi:uncharacterized protein
MLADVSAALAGGKALFLSDEVRLFENPLPSGAPQFDAPAKVSVKITNTGGALAADFSLSARFRVSCAGCAKEIEKEAEFSFQEFLRSGASAEETDERTTFFEGTSLDLLPVVEARLLALFETRYFCKHGCKGVCPTCGRNLNEEDCVCEKNETDPRFAALAHFFK